MRGRVITTMTGAIMPTDLAKYPIAYLLTALVTVAAVFPASAREATRGTCRDGGSIEVGKMGQVDAPLLQDHIDEVTSRLKRVGHARGSHLSYTRDARQHLADMREAMQVLRDELYLGGCDEARDRASLEARVEVLEKRMDATASH